MASWASSSHGSRRVPHVEDNLACKECRRRKANCDHKIPECSTCRRYRRHCLYDKNSRTPLTRKHLTQVEYRLQRAESILKRLFTDEEVTHLLDQDASGEIPELPAAQQSIHQVSGLETPCQLPSARLAGPQSNYAGNSSQCDPYEGVYPSVDYSDDEFEWDEQEHVASSVETVTDGFATPTGEGEQVVKDIMDGMATLTVDAANHGYLGTASGASHLRTMWMESGSGPAWDLGSRTERQRYMKQLLKQSQEVAVTSGVQAQALITRAMSDVFVDAYFALYHPAFPALHEPTFRAQYANAIPRSSQGTWLVLANMVAATGAFVSSTSSQDDTDIAIFKTAKQYLSMNCLEVGNLTMVQIFGLMAHYLQKRNKPNSGYSYGGLALRLAIGLGLHKELGGQKMTCFTREMRRRIWWSLCVLDVGATITYSRPLTWPQEGVDAAFPSNIHEEALHSGLQTQPVEANEATVCTYLREQSSYHLYTMPIYNQLISNPPPQADRLLYLDDTIVCAWVSKVPHYFTDTAGPTLDTRYALVHGLNTWRFRNLRIIMFRPFLVKWASRRGTKGEVSLSWEEQTATDRCLQAAQESITHIQSFWNSNYQTRLTAFYVLYFLFQAALIPVHCLRSKPSPSQSSSATLISSWRLQIESALQVIQSMTTMNPSASKCRDVILSLCGSDLRLPLQQEFISSSSSSRITRQEEGEAPTETGTETRMHDPMLMTTLMGGDNSSLYESTWDATDWMAGCASTLINEDIWAGSLDNINTSSAATGAEYGFGARGGHSGF